MEDITDNRLAQGPRERMVSCGNCLYWSGIVRDGREIMVCDHDGEETFKSDHCAKWEEA